MATLSDLEEVKAALDKGLVSQAEFDEVKRDYLRAKKECQKLELQAKKEALEANKEFQKKELRAKEEALEFQKRELIAKEAFQQKKSEADLRAYALESIVKHGSSLMSEEQKVDLVRDYAKMSGLDRSAENDERASKRQRPLPEERDAAPPQPSTPPAAAVLPPADAPTPAADAPTPADEEEYSNYSDGDGEDDSDDDEPRPEKQHQKRWTEEDEAALVAALRAGQRIMKIRIGGRPGRAARQHLRRARENGWGSPVLREYLEETCPEYVYKGPPKNLSWSAEEDQTFIQAHREGKTFREIAAMLPGRSRSAVSTRWQDAKIGKCGTAALRVYAAECCKG